MKKFSFPRNFPVDGDMKTLRVHHEGHEEHEARTRMHQTIADSVSPFVNFVLFVVVIFLGLAVDTIVSVVRRNFRILIDSASTGALK